MKKIPLAVQLYSLRGNWPSHPLETLRGVRKAGYTGVEFYGDFFSPEFHAALLKESGLVCAGWHTGLEELEGEKFESTLRKNMLAGNRFITVPWFNSAKLDDWKCLCDRLNAACEKFMPWGIRIGYHNHAQEFRPVEGVVPWELIAERTDPEITLQFDTGNCMSSGADMMQWLKNYPGRNYTIHCKPYSSVSGFDMTKGDDVPWNEVVRWASGEGKTEWLIVEYEETIEPEACIGRMYEKLTVG